MQIVSYFGIIKIQLFRLRLIRGNSNTWIIQFIRTKWRLLIGHFNWLFLNFQNRLSSYMLTLRWRNRYLTCDDYNFFLFILFIVDHIHYFPTAFSLNVLLHIWGRAIMIRFLLLFSCYLSNYIDSLSHYFLIISSFLSSLGFLVLSQTYTFPCSKIIILLYYNRWTRHCSGWRLLDFLVGWQIFLIKYSFCIAVSNYRSDRVISSS